ncbi:MAG TPA: hypothetical protein VJO53_04075 [Candidatus Acidoferrales bacterium]|nr:hypothetical protein [Candidatus Acidoferrales bacterium]
MKSGIRSLVILFAAIMAIVPRAAAQDASIEFVARATPSGGLEEPVRGFPFFLLTKSFQDISQEVDATDPKPSMDSFVDKLDSTYSPELKAWMKKNQCVSFAGEDFIHLLRPADVLGVPEFEKAYMERNAGDQSADFPKPKVKPSDEKKHPEKFEKLSADYVETVRHYIEQHPMSVDGIDLNLAEIDPGPKWNTLLGKRTPEIRRRALDLAQSTYLVARVETNLQGQGFLRGLRPGTYWLSTLDVAATVGDARPRWDVPVAVHAGETKYVALSNANSVQPARPSP